MIIETALRAYLFPRLRIERRGARSVCNSNGWTQRPQPARPRRGISRKGWLFRAAAPIIKRRYGFISPSLVAAPAGAEQAAVRGFPRLAWNEAASILRNLKVREHDSQVQSGA